MKFIERYITDRILEALKSHPIVFLNGARQTGKSTLVQNIAKKIGKEGVSATYVTFDKPRQMAAVSSAPEMFLSAYDFSQLHDRGISLIDAKKYGTFQWEVPISVLW